VTPRGRWAAGFAALSLLFLAGCGGDRSGGPKGTPAAIVGNAPDLTVAAGTAQVILDAPAGSGTGVADLRDGRVSLDVVRAPGSQKGTVVRTADGVFERFGTGWQKGAGPLLPDPLAAGDPVLGINLIRGMVKVLSDGGAQVRSASTFRYTVTVDPVQAREGTPPAAAPVLDAYLGARTARFPIDVWIDGKGLIRRVQVPTGLRGDAPPTTRSDFAPVSVTVDFVTFGVPVQVTTPQGAS
jgi:hypothetical protein